MVLKNECMEEKIKRVVSRTKMMFVYFWLLPVFLVAFGETGGEWVGVYAGDVRAAYFAETVTILLYCCVGACFLEAVFMDADQEDRCRCHYGCAASVCTCGVGCAWLCLPCRYWQDFLLII